MLDSSETDGNLVTRLRVVDLERQGEWLVPLSGGIDVINNNDKKFMDRSPAYIHLDNEYIDSEQREAKNIVVSWIGIDDELRTAEVDVSKSFDFKPFKQDN